MCNGREQGNEVFIAMLKQRQSFPKIVCTLTGSKLQRLLAFVSQQVSSLSIVFDVCHLGVTQFVLVQIKNYIAIAVA